MQQYRKAALDLHGMHADDQQWLLSQLPVAQSGRLSALLTELEELGIPHEESLLTAVADNLPRDPKPAEDGAEKVQNDVQMYQLRHVDSRLLAKVLADEPDAVVAALFDVANWPWENAVLNTFDETRRRSISSKREREANRISVKASSALHKCLLAKIEQASSVLGTELSSTATSVANPARRRRLMGILPWRK